MEQIKVRNTQLVDAASCLRKHYYVWVQNLKPKITDPKLQTGSLVHKFLEVYEGLDACYDDAWASMRAMYDEFMSKIPDDDMENREKATNAYRLANLMTRGFVDWRPSDLSPLVQAEAEFEVSLGSMYGVEVILKGTMDGIGETEDGIWLREYKTCASIPSKLQQYTLDKQTRRYVAAMRQEGVNIKGVELVLLAKTVPLEDEEFILKSKATEGLITRDKTSWAKATYEQALRVKELGKFAPPDAKQGLTEAGFHDILKMLKGRDNPFFLFKRLYFGKNELDTVIWETLAEGGRIYRTAEDAKLSGDWVWTRNQGIMGMNCKGCGYKSLCEMDLKGIDTSLVIQEHYEVVDPTTAEGVEDDEEVSE